MYLPFRRRMSLACDVLAFVRRTRADENLRATMKRFNSIDGDGRGFRATSGKQLAAAITEALAHKGGPTLIECTIDRDDCTKQLLQWGNRVAVANGRPPQRA